MHDEKVIQKIIEIDENLDAVKGELKEFLTKREFNTTMDKAMTILEKLDQERVFTSDWVKRIETDLAKSKQEIKQLKEHLGLSS